MLNVTRYSVSKPELNKLIKFFWHIETDTHVEVKHMLLPTDSIDVVINLGPAICYSLRGKIVSAAPCHFNNMREYASTIMQSGQLRLFGISFYPYGLYPFIKTPIHQLSGQIINADTVHPLLSADIQCATCEAESAREAVSAMEAVLSKHLSISRSEVDAIEILRKFQNEESSVNDFCDQACVEIKRLERLCQTYTGLNPKKLKRLQKIQAASNQIVKSDKTSSLTALAYDHDYFDQSHLIRDSRFFLGLTPRELREDHITVKAISKYSFR